ncbi:type II toxin-antitoxin system VapC family toxin [Rhodanobacter geophilus]|uniref:Type II toxin-antitoxin system VapC family toxin n=1 Tax=Rhodanobacter geophilus TaxID=3162488 RepID=A0ABV3QM04_9GAMM
MPVAFDANILIDLFNPRIKGDRRAKLDGLLEQYARTKIIIPTPSLTEYLVRAGKARDELLAKLSASRSFSIEPFDQRAATECALLLADHWDDTTRKQITRTKFKFDWQIAAIALSRNVTRIYSDDADLQRIGKALSLDVKGIDDLPIPDSARQANMSFPK